MQRCCIAISVVCLLMAAQGQADALAEGPTTALKRTNQRLNTLLRKRSKQAANVAKQTDAQIKKAINRFLDFHELARLALAKHWEGRTPAEQREFVEILRQLIERNYIKQLKSHLDYKVEYGEEKVDGQTARVSTTVSVNNDGREEAVAIEYRMKKTPAGWRVYDVITDEVSILRNYRSQFNRIIRRQSYQALVNKMKSKLETI